MGRCCKQARRRLERSRSSRLVAVVGQRRPLNLGDLPSQRVPGYLGIKQATLRGPWNNCLEVPRQLIQGSASLLQVTVMGIWSGLSTWTQRECKWMLVRELLRREMKRRVISLIGMTWS